MARDKSQFVCRECGAAAAKWQGQCDGCGSWNTLEEALATAVSRRGQTPVSVAPSARGNSRGFGISREACGASHAISSRPAAIMARPWLESPDPLIALLKLVVRDSVASNLPVESEYRRRFRVGSARSVRASGGPVEPGTGKRAGG